MLRGSVTTGKASGPKMAAPSSNQLQPRKQPPVSANSQRSEGDKKPLPPPPPHALTKSAAAKTTESASSHGGDSTATMNVTGVNFEELLRSLSGDVVRDYRSPSSTEMPPLEEVSTEERSQRNELYRNVQDLLGEVLAGIDAECASKRDKQQGLVILEDSERQGATVKAVEEDMPTELRATVAPPTGRSGVGRASCDLTVRFADNDDSAKSRPDSPASGARSRKKTTAAAQTPATRSKNQQPQPQPQQGSSLWPFRRNRVSAAKPGKNAVAASSNSQPKSKQPPRRGSAGATVDSQLLAAMDRKISWGKAKAYPGSVTLSELNDDGTGTSKTRSLRRIKKKRPAEAEPQPKPKSEGGTSLLRSILGIASLSQKTAATPVRPQAKGTKRPAKQQSSGSRQSSDKGSASGSKASSKPQQRKEKNAEAAPKEAQPLPSLKEVPENAVAPDVPHADYPEGSIVQVPSAKDHKAPDAVAADTRAVQESVAEAAGGQCMRSGPESWIVPVIDDEDAP
ncbi:hypothetical protein HPB49_006514 [Dermacentor silvarum]|uniref:Uncharacterized protein n=1 Tax=Dermacentor silvarum TaxID=543639 RepID=A0ACB8D3D8_DERSI|nr:hypothetical protein HPB49_006514 [Dermacentor silvarum]